MTKFENNPEIINALKEQLFSDEISKVLVDYMVYHSSAVVHRVQNEIIHVEFYIEDDFLAITMYDNKTGKQIGTAECDFPCHVVVDRIREEQEEEEKIQKDIERIEGHGRNFL